MANRPQTLEDRRTNLSDRMTGGREDWQDHRGDMQNDRQDWHDNNREDWQDFANEHHEHHGDWYNDCWHGDWDPGDGWNAMWDNYPVAAAFGVTRWGVNRLAYGFGYWGYSNPYVTSGASYNYSEPLVVYSDNSSSVTVNNTTETVQAPADASASSPPQPGDEGMTAFEEARTAFYSGDYEKSLTLLDTTLKTMPRDTVVHEFRSLVLFALKKYPESAAAIYAVLSAGPGWDWTTMSGLYPAVDVYTQQLRQLEDFTSVNPQSADGHFLLGYHYLTMGHRESAGKAFTRALELLPGDKLLTQLAEMTAPAGAKPKQAPPAPPAAGDAPAKDSLTVEKLTGKWKASSADAQFELQLNADGAFVWTYTRGSKSESVRGAFAVDQNNLAMEPDAGGTMLSEITMTDPSTFQFKMIGGDEGDQGLKFTKI